MGIEKLPDELLLPILEYVNQEITHSTIIGCITLCKRWSIIALAVFYRNFVIHNSPGNSLRLLRFTKIREQNLILIRSLTLNLELLRDIRPTIEFPVRLSCWGLLLGPFLQNLESMVALKTFSLQGPEYNEIFWIPHRVISRIVQALPKSCDNLEIDMKGGDQDSVTSPREDAFSEKGDVHLCSAINSILPQLRHLRLNVSCICAALFGEPNPRDAKTATRRAQKPQKFFPNLNTLYINAKDSYSCTKNTPPLPHTPLLVILYGDIGVSIARSLHHIYTRTPRPFPSAVSIIVTDNEHVISPENKYTEFDAFVFRDVIGNKTRHVINKKVCPPLELEERMTKKDSGRVYMVRLGTKTGHDFMGSKEDVDQAAENMFCHWVSTITGSRVPITALLDTDIIAGADIEKANLWKKRTKSKYSIMLWLREARSGAQCLSSLEWKGVGSRGSVSLIVPVGFRTITERLEKSGDEHIAVDIEPIT